MNAIKRYWFGGLMGAALLARLPQLAMPLWYDEAWTQWVVNLPFARMWSAVTGDVHPLGYFVLTWLLARVAPWALRLIPLACSLAAIWLAQIVARELRLTLAAQVVTALLMALSPWSIYYGAELRAYSMLELAVLCAWLGALRRHWGWMAAGMYLALMSHNIGLVYCAVIGVYALWQTRAQKAWLRPLAAGLATLAAYAGSGGLSLARQAAAIADGYWIARPGLANVILAPYEFLFLGADNTLTVLALVITLVLLAGAWRLRRQPPAPFLLLAAGAPLAIELGISLISTPIFLNRTLIGCVPFFYLLVGLVLARCSPARRVLAAASMLPVFAAVLVVPLRLRVTERYQTADVYRLIRSEAPNMPVWHMGVVTLVELHQYDLPNPQYLDLRFETSVNSGHYSEQTIRALGIDQGPLALDRPTWVIIPKDEAVDADARLAQICDQHRCQLRLSYVDHEPLYGVEVYEVWP